MLGMPVRPIAAAVLTLAGLFIVTGGAFAQDRPVMRMEQSDVDWQELRAQLEDGRLKRITVPASLTGRHRDRISQCRIPILVASNEDMASGFTLVARQNTYSAFYQRNGYTIEIIGSRMARRSGVQSSARRALSNRRRGGVVIQNTDYGIELSFSKFRVAYNISVLCERPGVDEFCYDEEYVRGLYGNIAYMGGEPEGGL